MKKENILEELLKAGIEISDEVVENIPEEVFDNKIFFSTPPIRY